MSEDEYLEDDMMDNNSVSSQLNQSLQQGDQTSQLCNWNVTHDENFFQ